ncbi:hypothetical protein BH11ARM2_BH11ARM2_03570 [soil metagenome]
MGEHEEGTTKDQLYPELAKANLLRMRGDRKGAIDQCLSVLKRAPDDVDAHILIAEIYEEEGDLAQAAQWYELALDLDPRNASLKQKLDYVQEESRARESAGATKNLTLPPEKPPTGLYLSIIAAIALVVGFGAFLVGRQPAVAQTPPANGTVRIDAPKDESPAHASVETPDADPKSMPAPDLALPEEDRALLKSLTEGSPQGATLVAAIQDPRTNALTLTYAASTEASEPSIAAEGARNALGKVLSAASAVVRVGKAGKLTYVATVERSRLAETETPTWRQANPNPEAWLRHVLQDEWGSAVSTGTVPTETGTEPASNPTGTSTAGP